MKKIKHLLYMTGKVYRERGLKLLFVRFFVYLEEFFRTVFFYIKYYNKWKNGGILYVSGCPGGSQFYRCYNQAEELEKYGINSFVVSQGNFALSRLVNKFDVFVFQRVICNPFIEETVEKIKQAGKPIIFETDDLVYDPKFIQQLHYYNYFSKEEKTWYDNGIGREFLEDPYVKNCIVSTHFLAGMMKKKYPEKNIFISTNKLSRGQVEWAGKAYEKKDNFRPDDGKIRVGYFSGSRSHDKDFDTVAGVLLKILKENPKVILMIVGHLELDERFENFKNQTEKHSFVSMPDLPKLFLRANVNIAPLEISNPFCQAKSGLKFFEAGLLAVPTVATATDSFQRIIRDGENGFLASNDQEWHDKLKLLIESRELREKMGERAREDSLNLYTTSSEDDETKKLAEFISKVKS